jgi:hypothetical protein
MRRLGRSVGPQTGILWALGEAGLAPAGSKRQGWASRALEQAVAHGQVMMTRHCEVGMELSDSEDGWRERFLSRKGLRYGARHSIQEA